MRLLKQLWYSWDPDPPTWQATLRLGLILVVGETLVCLALIQIINALIRLLLPECATIACYEIRRRSSATV
jgi:hypothetical protein